MNTKSFALLSFCKYPTYEDVGQWIKKIKIKKQKTVQASLAGGRECEEPVPFRPAIAERAREAGAGNGGISPDYSRQVASSLLTKM